jgi:1-acyl-sn-glycerol-3-phosphate acyltransferase
MGAGLQAGGGARRRAAAAAAAAALSFWMLGVVAAAAWVTLTFALAPAFPAACAASAALIAALLAAPLEVRPPAWARRFMAFSIRAAYWYFPVVVVHEDRAALRAGRPYVVAYEPHGVLPLGIVAFAAHNRGDPPPPGLAGSRVLVSSAGFWMPAMRHAWYWMGCRPASRATAEALLARGASVVLSPGGARECLHMRRGEEVAFLRARSGFVRLALRHGAPLVPVFAFGQSDMFDYVRPFVDAPRRGAPPAAWARLCGALGFVPMLVSGRWGLPIPRRAPLTIVVGAPIEVPRVADPPAALVDEYLAQFVAALEALFARHRAAAGFAARRLTVV